MAKGRTNQPLRLLIVGRELYESPPVQELIENGHSVALLDESEEFDLILGANCWFMVPKLLLYLQWALKDSRRVRRERAKESEESEGSEATEKPNKAKGKTRSRRKRTPKSEAPSEVVPSEVRAHDAGDEPSYLRTMERAKEGRTW